MEPRCLLTSGVLRLHRKRLYFLDNSCSNESGDMRRVQVCYLSVYLYFLRCAFNNEKKKEDYCSVIKDYGRVTTKFYHHGYIRPNSLKYLLIKRNYLPMRAWEKRPPKIIGKGAFLLRLTPFVIMWNEENAWPPCLWKEAHRRLSRERLIRWYRTEK